MAESAVQIVTTPRRLISLTKRNNVNIVVDLNEVHAVEQPVNPTHETILHMKSGEVIGVIEHFNHVLDKWVGHTKVDYSIEGEDTL